MPDKQLFHYISDDDLDRIGGAAHPEPMQQVFWAAAGVFFGGLQGAVDALVRATRAPGTLDIPAIIPVLLVAVSASLAIAAGIGWWHRARQPDMRAVIRARRRVPTSAIPDLDHR